MHNSISRINEIRTILTDLESLVRTPGGKAVNYKSCLTCESWSISEELCTKWNMLPPPNIIVATCDDYREFDIPF